MNAILIILLLIGGGTSIVAKSSLPGDPLYPVKVNINEGVRGWFALSNEARADWESNKAERRLEEAERLAVNGDLSVDETKEVKIRFEKSAKLFNEKANKLEDNEDVEALLEAYSNFEASLRAHEEILADIVAGNNENSKLEAQLILSELQEELNAIVKARALVEVKITSKDNDGLKNYTEAKLNLAENKVSKANELVADVKANGDFEISASMEAKLKMANDLLAQGEAEIKAKTYGKAVVSLQESIRLAEELKLLIRTRGNIENAKNDDADDKENISSDSSVEIKSDSNIKVDVDDDDESTSVDNDGKIRVNLDL